MKLIDSCDLYTVGVFDSDYTFPGKRKTEKRTVEYYEIEVFDQNGGTTFLGNEPHKIRKGLVICAKPGFIRYSELPLRTFYLKVKAFDKDINSILDSIPDAFSVRDFETPITILKSMLAAQTEGDNLYRHAKFFEFLSILNKDALRFQQLSTIDKRGGDAVSDGIEYIENNYSSKCTLEDIAAHVHFSPVYFHGVFKRAIGKTPYEYVTEVRIESAKQKLILSDDDISAIAQSCGFSTQSYFNHVFKKFVGINPGTFRRIHLNKLYNYDGEFTPKEKK